MTDDSNRTSLDPLRSFFDNAPIGIYRTSPDGRFLVANPSLLRMLGYRSFEELADRNLETESLGPDYSRKAFKEQIERDGVVENLEALWTRRDGSTFWIKEWARAVRDARGDLVAYEGIVEDITERKRVTEARDELARHDESLVRALGEIVYDHDVVSDRITWNGACFEILGYRNEEMGADRQSWLKRVHPEDRLAVDQENRQCIDRGWYDIEYRYRGRDGGYRWVHDRGVVHAGTAAPERVIGVMLDVTARKSAELFKQELIAIAAHELRSPLTSIVNCLEWIEGSGRGLTESERDLVRVAARNSERMMHLIEDILDADRAESGEMVFDSQPLEVMPLVEQAASVNQALATGFDVTLAVEQRLPGAMFEGDPARLGRVLTNLLSNAIKFSPAGEVVTLSVTRREGRIRVAVRDRGPGVQKELRDRVFEKFARTRAAEARRRGSGLGLAISKAIVEGLGGEIGFDTVEGEGSTFYFELPEGRG